MGAWWVMCPWREVVSQQWAMGKQLGKRWVGSKVHQRANNVTGLVVPRYAGGIRNGMSYVTSIPE